MLSTSPSFGDPIGAAAADQLKGSDGDTESPFILTSQQLTKSLSAQSIMDQQNDSVIVAAISPVPSPLLSSSPKDIPLNPVLQKSTSLGLSRTPPDDDKKMGRVKSMLRIKSPFKLKKDEPGSSGGDSTEARHKKDCSVTVKVFEARNLPEARQRRKIAERNSKALHRAQKIILEVSSPNLMNFSDATDPYCVVQVEKMKMRTRTIEKKLNPFWCEEFTFEVQDPMRSKIVLNLVDDKKYAQTDEVIGRLIVPINSLHDQREREQWLPIQPPHSSNKIPQIHMYIEYNPNPSDDRKPQFTYQVLGGRNLGLGVPGVAHPTLDCAWKLKDGTTKEESIVWNGLHAAAAERELSAPLEMFTLTVWRWVVSEDDSSSNGKEKQVIGQVVIPLVDMSAPRDFWFCLYPKSDVELGDLRVKIKYTEEVVLTLEQYHDFLELLQDPKIAVVHTLGAVAKQNTREGIAYNLVRVFEKTGKGAELLDRLNSDEIDSTPNPDIIFRGNSLATKSVDQYMKLVGMPYLSFVLKALIKRLYMSNKCCEVDPSKLEKGEDLKQNWKNLLYWVNLFTNSIFDSIDHCPTSLRQVFHGIYQKCKNRYPGDVARYTAVSGFIFLRFFCPGILAPKLFNLAPDHPGIKQTRYLILVAKTLQNLANLVEFGSVKEEFMKNMNEFVVANMDNMRKFIDNVSTIPEEKVPTPPTNLNLEKELASMYRHIIRHKDEIIEYQQTRANEVQQQAIEKLLSILVRLEQQVKVANAGQK